MQSHYVFFDQKYLNSSDIQSQENLITKILRRQKSASIKKLDNWTYLNYPVYRAKISDKARLFFLYITYQGKETIFILRKDETHDYRDVKRSLSSLGAAAVESCIFTFENTPNEEVASEPVEIKKGVYFQHQFVLLDESQNKALVQQLPLLLVGAAGTGKTLSLYQLLLHNTQRTEKPILFLCATERMCQQLQAQYEEEHNIEKPKVIFKTAESLLFDVYREKIQVNDAYFSEWLKKQKQFVLQDKDSKVLYYELSLLEALGEKSYFASGGRQSYLSEDERKKLPGLLKSWKNYLEQTNRCDLFVCNLGVYFQTHYSQLFADELQNYPPAMIASLLKVLREVLQSNHFVATFDDEQCLLSLPYMLGCIKRILHEIYGSYTEHYLPNTWRSVKEIVTIANHVLHFKHVCDGGRKKRVYSAAKSALEKSGLVSCLTEKSLKRIKLLHEKSPNTVVIVPGELMDNLREEIKSVLGICQIVTPAQAIGLDFETVILWNPFSSKAKIWQRFCQNNQQSKVLSEDEFVAFNELYVAIMRAQNSVFIYESEMTRYQVLLNECFGEMQTDVLEIVFNINTDDDFLVDNTNNNYHLNNISTNKKIPWEKRIEDHLKLGNVRVAKEIMQQHFNLNSAQIEERIKLYDNCNSDNRINHSYCDQSKQSKENRKNKQLTNNKNSTQNILISTRVEIKDKSKKNYFYIKDQIKCEVIKLQDVPGIKTLMTSRNVSDIQALCVYHHVQATTDRYEISIKNHEMKLGNQAVYCAKLLYFVLDIPVYILELVFDNEERKYFSLAIESSSCSWENLREIMERIGIFSTSQFKDNVKFYSTEKSISADVNSVLKFDILPLKLYMEMANLLISAFNMSVHFKQKKNIQLISVGCGDASDLLFIRSALIKHKNYIENVIMSGLDPNMLSIEEANKKIFQLNKKSSAEKVMAKIYCDSFNNFDNYILNIERDLVTQYNLNWSTVVNCGILANVLTGDVIFSRLTAITIMQKMIRYKFNFIVMGNSDTSINAIDERMAKAAGLQLITSSNFKVVSDKNGLQYQPLTVYRIQENLERKAYLSWLLMNARGVIDMIDLSLSANPYEDLLMIEESATGFSKVKILNISNCLICGNEVNLIADLLIRNAFKEVIIARQDQYGPYFRAKFTHTNIKLTYFYMPKIKDVLTYSIHELAHFGLLDKRFFSSYSPVISDLMSWLNSNIDITLFVNKPFVNNMLPVPLLALEGNDVLMDVFLSMGANVNAVTMNGERAISIAVEVGHVHIVQKLLNARADVNFMTNTGMTPLTIAIMKKNVEMVKLLLAEDVCIFFPCKRTKRDLCLLTASEPLLLANQCFRKDDMAFDVTPLELVSMIRNEEIQRCFNDVIERKGLMFHAIIHGNFHWVFVLLSFDKLLCNMPAKKNLSTSVIQDVAFINSLTPLYVAVLQKNTSIIQLLLDCGAKVDESVISLAKIQESNRLFKNEILTLLLTATESQSQSNLSYRP